MTHFDLFSGYGGFTLALKRAYNDLQSSEMIQQEWLEKDKNMSDSGKPLLGTQPLTIGFSEIDKYASAVLKYRWPNIKNYGDIKKIDWSEVPDFDILTGGSPCQDLSIAGKRAGLSGERSGLFREFLRAVVEKKPRYFIWENVKGALSSQKGWDFGVVLNEMAEAGYSLWWQVLNAKDFGVPQNRERIFVVGFRDGSPREVFFNPRTDRKNNQISENYKQRKEKYIATRHLSRNGKLKSNISATIQVCETPHVLIPEATKKGYAVAKQGDSINLSVPNSKTRRGRVGKGVAQTLDTGMQQYTINRERIRRLMPIECERLMGLPDYWTAKGIMNDKEVEISDSQRYKMCGNGVVVNVVEEIIKELIIGNQGRA